MAHYLTGLLFSHPVLIFKDSHLPLEVITCNKSVLSQFIIHSMVKFIRPSLPQVLNLAKVEALKHELGI